MIEPPRFHFTQAPTPIFPVKRYPVPAGYRLWVKRDDFTGIELSGNKVRKLDYLLKDALIKGAQRVITCGGVQSNHCRTTAYLAAKLGLKTTLFLRGQAPHNRFNTGNHLLNRILDVEIRYVTPEEYQEVDALMKEYSQQSADKCYIIPEGGSNHLGAWGYAQAFREIVQQEQRLSTRFDTVVVATGSGGTMAGLLLGRWLSEVDKNIVSVNVCDDAPFFKKKINQILNDVAANYKLNGFKTQEIKIVDGYVGSGYGEVSAPVLDTIKQVARSEGWILDPVYGAKAFMGMVDQMQRGTLPGENILFVHTGGIFGVFPYGDLF